ncbi:MAG: YcgL domain-containing protein [Panacagrimonas sp.]
METPGTSIPCSIYRGSKQAELYLYVRSDLDIAKLPASLLKRVGTLTQAMQIELTPERKLARVDVRKVIQSLETQGWYLQFPPDGQVRANLYFGD